MVLTVQDAITESLLIIGAVASGETPNATELAGAIRTANIMLDRWSAQRLMLRSDSTVSFTTTANKPAYTVGLGGTRDITSNKIIAVRSATVTDSNMVYQLEVQTDTFYNSLEDRNVSTGRPMYIAYDPGDAQQSSQYGTLFLYFTPEKSYTIDVETSQYLTELVNASDTLTLEPAYYEAFVYNLAERLFRQYHAMSVPLPMDIAKIAHESKKVIENMNATQIIAGFDLPGKVSKYNVYTDGA